MHGKTCGTERTGKGGRTGTVTDDLYLSGVLVDVLQVAVVHRLTAQLGEQKGGERCVEVTQC